MVDMAVIGEMEGEEVAEVDLEEEEADMVAAGRRLQRQSDTIVMAWRSSI